MKNKTYTKKRKSQKSFSNKIQFTSKQVLLSLVGLIFITFIIYSPTLKNDFVTRWDDQLYVTENSMIQEISIDDLGKFGENVAGNFHPLTMLSLAIDYHFFKLDPFYYHLKNLIFHLISSVLVFILILKVSKNNLFVSFFTALLFAIHPMHVESVAWISERKDVLYSFYFLIGLLLYYKYLNTRKILFFILTSISFVLSILAKSAAVIFPIILILLDFYEDRKIKLSVIVEKVILIFVSIFFGVIALKTQAESSAVQEFTSSSFFDKASVASYGLIAYLRKFFWPEHLSNFHPYFEMTNSFKILNISLALVILLILIITVKNQKYKWVFWGLSFYIITIALVLKFLPFGNTIISERYTYIPYIGISFVFISFIDLLIKKYPSFKKIGIGLLIVQSLILAKISYSQTKIWKDSISLWTNAINKYPNSTPVIYNHRGASFYDQGDYKNALTDYTAALNLKSDYPEALSGRGTTYFKLQHYEKALNDFNNYLSVKPNDLEILYKRVMCFVYKNDFENALVEINKMIKVDPNQGSYYQTRSFIQLRLGNKENALKDILKAQKMGISVDAKYIQALKT